VGDTSDASFTIAAPQVRVTAPDAAAVWDVGTTQTIAWSHNLGTGEAVRIDVSRNGGASWSPVVASVPNASLDTGSAHWTVAAPLTDQARVRIVWTRNPAVQDKSDVDVVIR
jgi:hypothetical protein